MTDTPGTMEERARRIVARFYQRIRDHDYAQWVMEGRKDGTNDMRLVITALTEAADEIASLRARVEALEGALVDLTSWFPEKPSDPEWRIKGGVFGADDAVEHARSLVEKEIDT